MDKTPADMPKVIPRHERDADIRAATLKRRATSPLPMSFKRRQTLPMLGSTTGGAVGSPGRLGEQDFPISPAASEIHQSLSSQTPSLRQASATPPVALRQLSSSASPRPMLPSPPSQGIRNRPLVVLAATAFKRIKQMNQASY